MATRYVAAQPVAAPNRPVAREISGNLAIGGDVGKEDSARKPGGRSVRFQIFPTNRLTPTQQKNGKCIFLWADTWKYHDKFEPIVQSLTLK